MNGRLTCRSWSNAGAIAVAMLAFGTMMRPAAAQESEPVVRVEEDWEAVIFEPSPAMESPQYQTVMTPDGFASFEIDLSWNYAWAPCPPCEDYRAGGFGMSIWGDCS